MSRWLFSTMLLLCVCESSRAPAAVLPTDLQPRVAAVDDSASADERAAQQGLDELEAAIRTSPQRLVAPELDAYTRRVVERLIGRPAPEIRIYLMHDASFNAAMFPTGMMIVNTGVLIRARNEAQFAAVLGHEAGHYFRRHALDRYRDFRHKAAMAELAADAAREGTGFGPSAGFWNQINFAIELSLFKFNRQQESEADAYGLMLMSRAGYPPQAASVMCEQLIAERRASAAARGRRGDGSGLSTHPPTVRRITDLADTAGYLAAHGPPPRGDGHEDWDSVVGPYQAMLLREQVYLNDPGASLYLLENLAKNGRTGLLRFEEGEVYRLRAAQGDAPRAAAAFADSTTRADAPPDAWRAHGYALRDAGDHAAARAALDRYLAIRPAAVDAAMIRAEVDADALVAGVAARAPGAHLVVTPGNDWKRLPASAKQSRWEDVWTWRGPQSDRLALIDGLPDGKAIVFPATNTDQQVPVFRADMTAHDLASMLEVAYRVRGVSVFDVESVEPVEFLGGPGVRLQYDYASGIVFAKKGRCVMRIVDGRLYAMKLETVAHRDVDALAREFDRLVAAATL